MVGILVSFWDGLLSGAMLVSGVYLLENYGSNPKSLRFGEKMIFCCDF